MKDEVIHVRLTAAGVGKRVIGSTLSGLGMEHLNGLLRNGLVDENRKPLSYAIYSAGGKKADKTHDVDTACRVVAKTLIAAYGIESQVIYMDRLVKFLTEGEVDFYGSQWNGNIYKLGAIIIPDFSTECRLENAYTPREVDALRGFMVYAINNGVAFILGVDSSTPEYLAPNLGQRYSARLVQLGIEWIRIPMAG